MPQPTTPSHPNRLRELREASDLSVEGLAAELRVRRETVDRWERNGIPAKHLHMLADRFAVTISYLLRDEREAA